MPIIDYKKSAQTSIARLQNNKKISEKNLEDFQEYMEAVQTRITPARQQIIANHIVFLLEKIPDVVGTMQDRRLVNKVFAAMFKDLSPGYLETVKKVGKAFVRWHNHNKTPEGWEDIKSGGKDIQKRDLEPKDMLNMEDAEKLSATTPSVQLKAAIMVQLDAGFRPSEFIDIHFGDVKLDKCFAEIRVKGKTGKRTVILFRSVPYLKAWLKAHPTKADSDPLWVQENGSSEGLRPYNYAALTKRIREIGERAKIKKPLDFYSMRHSACYLSKMDNINPEWAARKFGHSVKYYTDTYARLSVEDDKKRLAQHYGVGKEFQERAEQVYCEICGHANKPKAEVCDQCHNPLTMGKALEMVNETQSLKQQMASLVAQVADLADMKTELANRRRASKV